MKRPKNTEDLKKKKKKACDGASGVINSIVGQMLPLCGHTETKDNKHVTQLICSCQNLVLMFEI